MSTHVAVVGAYGSAGVAAAERLAEVPDLELTLLDDGEPGGGLCILRGCMPSKEILSAAEHRFVGRTDDRLGGPPHEVDLEAVVDRKDEHTSSFAAHRRAAVEALAERDDVTFVHDTARFVDGEGTGATDGSGDPDAGAAPRLAVGDRTLEPDYVVLATGSLSVVEHDARPLDEADAMFGDALLAYYEEQFDVDVLTHTHEQRLEPTDDGGVRLHVERDGDPDVLEADQLFAFTGRRPTLDALNLEATSLEPVGGWVDDTMQTVDNDRVFLVGDANAREPILHVAKEEGHVAAENVRRHRDGEPLEPYVNVPHHVVFSGLGVLPFVRVGHSAASAETTGLDHVVVTREAADDGVFKTKDVPEGLARLVVADDGTVLGYQGLHYHADVMAKTMQVVVEMGLDVREVPDRAYHPTTPEILDGLFRDAADALEE
ncbi:NAD(P)/FAD-dependent oxidoreductase [Halobacteriales archaeon QH_7_69_31]|nr:MAG: NAD(P)/FAD-dependent oxidoreductase [Halobacteriales archaeon QH_7_69_31]